MEAWSSPCGSDGVRIITHAACVGTFYNLPLVIKTTHRNKVIYLGTKARVHQDIPERKQKSRHTEKGI